MISRWSARPSKYFPSIFHPILSCKSVGAANRPVILNVTAFVQVLGNLYRVVFETCERSVGFQKFILDVLNPVCQCILMRLNSRIPFCKSVIMLCWSVQASSASSYILRPKWRASGDLIVSCPYQTEPLLGLGALPNLSWTCFDSA